MCKSQNTADWYLTERKWLLSVEERHINGVNAQTIEIKYSAVCCIQRQADLFIALILSLHLLLSEASVKSGKQK